MSTTRNSSFKRTMTSTRQLLFTGLLALMLVSSSGSLDKSGSKPGFRIYVTNENSGDLSVIDGSTLDVLATVPLGKRPRGIHASPDGKTIYVALSGSPIGGPGVDESKLPPPDKTADGIGVFDVQQNKLLRLIQSGSDPENFDLSRDGRHIFVSNEDDSKASMIDVASGKVTKAFAVGEEPEGVKIAPNRKFVYITSEDTGTISVIDIAAEKIIKTFKVGRRPRSVAFMPNSTRAYVNAENDGTVTVVDCTKHEAVETITLGERGVIKPMAVLLSRDASKLYVSTGRGHKVFVIDTATNRVSGSFEVGERPWGIALSPDGKTLYTANGPSNDISVVDLATQTVVHKVKVGRGPWGVLVLEQ
jgi:YVTN family beta-propeller protein